MLAHGMATARGLAPAAIDVVYGQGGEQVRAAFDDQPDLVWAEQTQQLGTGHAVQQAMPAKNCAASFFPAAAPASSLGMARMA